MRNVLLLTLSALLVGSVAGHFPAVVIKSCVKESKVKALDLALLYGNNGEDTSREGKCYFTCLFENMGLTVDGKVNTALLGGAPGRTAEENAGLKVIKACKDVEASGDCEIGFALYKCFRSFGLRAITEQTAEPRDIE